MRQTETRKLDYLIQLDGLRGLAALAVVVYHAWGLRVPYLPSFGNMGVEVFFVLSGFLITRILLAERSQSEAAGVGRGHVIAAFYARRSLRIFPLYYLAVFAATAIGLAGVREHLGWYLSYMVNYYRAYLSPDGIGPLGHFWSLCVEEQFYLAWPALILFLPRQFLLPALIATICGSFAVYFALMETPVNWAACYLTPCRLSDLGIGAAVAWLRQGSDAPRRDGICRLALMFGLTLFTVSLMMEVADRCWVSRTTLSLFGRCLIWAYLVNRAAGGFDGFWKKVLEARPLVYLGSISYGIYVYHFPLPFAIRELEKATGMSFGLPEQEQGFAMFVYVLSGTIALATISWYLYEKPLNDLKRFFPYQRQASVSPRTETEPEERPQPLEVPDLSGVAEA